VAWARNDLGLLEQSRGNPDAARGHFERALAIWEKTSGADHPDVAWPLVNLAELARERGDVAGSEAMCTRALRVVEATSGPEHPDAIHPLACLGSTLAMHQPDRATPLLERALRLADAMNDSATIGAVHFALARAALAGRARPRAADHARAALAAFDKAGPDSARDRAEVAGWMKQNRLGD
jgi:tetratricopeptide (TPR) repeat protein